MGGAHPLYSNALLFNNVNIMTYSNGNGNGSSHDRDDDYYSWEAEVLRSEDLDTETNESPAKDATIEESDEDE